jgi:hypothetical protein
VALVSRSDGPIDNNEAHVCQEEVGNAVLSGTLFGSLSISLRIFEI